MSWSDGQAVKVCWVIKGYALNTVPFLLVTMSTVTHTHTLFVYSGLARLHFYPSGLCSSMK